MPVFKSKQQISQRARLRRQQNTPVLSLNLLACRHVLEFFREGGTLCEGCEREQTGSHTQLSVCLIQSPPKSRDLSGFCIVPYAAHKFWDLDWLLSETTRVFWSA